MISRRNFFKRLVALTCVPVIATPFTDVPVADVEKAFGPISVSTGDTYFIPKGYKLTTNLDVVLGPWAVA